MAQQKYNEAYDAYQQAVYRDSNNPTFWCSIGVLYFQINQHRDALDAYTRAIRINPYISELWYDLGTLYEWVDRCVGRARGVELTNPISPTDRQTTKSTTPWTPTNAPWNWIPTTRTSNNVCRCSVPSNKASDPTVGLCNRYRPTVDPRKSAQRRLRTLDQRPMEAFTSTRSNKATVALLALLAHLVAHRDRCPDLASANLRDRLKWLP